VHMQCILIRCIARKLSGKSRVASLAVASDSPQDCKDADLACRPPLPVTSDLRNRAEGTRACQLEIVHCRRWLVVAQYCTRASSVECHWFGLSCRKPLVVDAKGGGGDTAITASVCLGRLVPRAHKRHGRPGS
jgi:hypothetical protein